MLSMFTRVLGSDAPSPMTGLWIRAQFIAGGTYRAFDSDMGPVVNLHASWYKNGLIFPLRFKVSLVFRGFAVNSLILKNSIKHL